jgi:hypothetical protein
MSGEMKENCNNFGREYAQPRLKPGTFQIKTTNVTG